ncbi:thioester domain-containing protein [Mycetocola zhujimingii]|nr:thioester domain-containing protein [Mycetocola zhujimingii]
MFFAPSPSAQARVSDPSPIADPVFGPNTDIYMTGSGAGLTIDGFQPPTAITQDPAAPYPTTDPAGYELLSTFAGIINTASIDDPSLVGEMYCINLRVSTQTGIGYESGTWEETNVPNIGYVTYILNTYYPATSLPAGLTDDQRATAVQAAIWYFTDGYVVSSAEADIRAAAAAIVADAQTNGPAAEPVAPEVTVAPPSAAAPIGTPAGPFVVEAQDDASLTVSVPAGSEMFSDAAATVPLANPGTVASGTSIWVTNSAGAASETVLSARAAVTVPAGQVYLYDGNNPDFTDAQRLILASTTDLEATAEATATFFAVGALTIQKSFVGAAAGTQGPSQLLIDCGPGYVFTADIPGGTTSDEVFEFENIPAGSTCSVTEPVLGTNTVAVVTSDAPVEVGVPEAGASAIVTNTVEFQPGGLEVTKVITGAAAGNQGEIVLLIDCGEVLSDSFVIPANQPAGEYVRAYAELPAGTECTVTESTSGQSSAIEVEPAADVTVTIAPGAVAEAVLTNTVTAADGWSEGNRLPATGAEPALPLLLAGSTVGGGLLLVLASALMRRRTRAARE